MSNKRIDLQFLLDYNYVRQVNGDVVANLHNFNFITELKFCNLTIFYYVVEIGDDLLVLRRESFYLKRDESFIHQQSITVYEKMTLKGFADMFSDVMSVEEG